MSGAGDVMVFYRRKHALKFAHDIIIGEPKHSKASCRQPCVARGVAVDARLKPVSVAVYFHDQLRP